MRTCLTAIEAPRTSLPAAEDLGDLARCSSAARLPRGQYYPPPTPDRYEGGSTVKLEADSKYARVPLRTSSPETRISRPSPCAVIAAS